MQLKAEGIQRLHAIELASEGAGFEDDFAGIGGGHGPPRDNDLGSIATRRMLGLRFGGGASVLSDLCKTENLFRKIELWATLGY